MPKCQCVYGVVYNGCEEITVAYILDPENAPRVLDLEAMESRRGKAFDYVDKRKGYASHYNYCPYCGKKLKYKDIQDWAKFVDEEVEKAMRGVT